MSATLLSTVENSSDQTQIPGFEEMDDIDEQVPVDISEQSELPLEKAVTPSEPEAPEEPGELDDQDELLSGLGESLPDSAPKAQIEEAASDSDAQIEEPPAVEQSVQSNELIEQDSAEPAEEPKDDSVDREVLSDEAKERARDARRTLSEVLSGNGAIQGQPLSQTETDQSQVIDAKTSSTARMGAGVAGGGLLTAMASRLKKGVEAFTGDSQAKLAGRYAASVALLDEKMRAAEEAAWELDKSPLGQQRKILLESGTTPKGSHYDHLMQNNEQLSQLITRYEQSVEDVGKQARKTISDGKSAGMSSSEMTDSVGKKMDEFNENMREAVEGLFGAKGKKLFEAVEKMMGQISSFVTALFQRLTGGMRNG